MSLTSLDDDERSHFILISISFNRCIHIYIWFVCVCVCVRERERERERLCVVKGGPRFIWPLHNDFHDPLPVLISPFINPTPRMKRRNSLVGCRGSRMLPQYNGPRDVMLDKPHSHIGYAWLIHLFIGTFHRRDYLLIPVSSGVLLGDSAL
jgi:hypothetical protein